MAKTGRQIRIMVSTFNMGNAKAEGLENLVPPCGGGFDILAMGMQESTYFQKEKGY